MPKYDIQRGPAGLLVRVGEAKVAKGAANARPLPPPGRSWSGRVKPQLATVKAVDLRTDEGKTRVVVLLDSPSSTRFTRPDPTTAVLTLHAPRCRSGSSATSTPPLSAAR